jgi:hypothetical protein
VTVERAVSPAAAAELRASLGPWARYALVDRGSYAHAPARALPLLADLAARTLGRALTFVDARALRLGAGDYLLARHDRTHDEPLVEVTLDLSAAPTPGAELHYRRRGDVYARFASTPCAAFIVDRDATITCNHTYVSRLHATADVLRLVARYHSRGSSP